MTEPSGEGRVLALIEAEFRAGDPALIALFDAFARHRPAPGVPRRRTAGRERRKALAKSILAIVLVPLAVMAMLAALGGRKAATGRPPCPPLSASAHPPPAGTGCPAAAQARGSAPPPAHARPPSGAGGGAFASIAHAYSGVTGLGRSTAATVAMWAVRQGRVIRARICQSIPPPAAIACQ